MRERVGVGCKRLDVLKADDYSAGILGDMEDTSSRKCADKGSFLVGGESSI
jgi:hypothetical protein